MENVFFFNFLAQLLSRTVYIYNAYPIACNFNMPTVLIKIFKNVEVFIQFAFL